MTLQDILKYLAPFESLLKPELLKLEMSAAAELDTVIATVSSPDLKLLLVALKGALDSFAQQEIAKLP